MPIEGTVLKEPAIPLDTVDAVILQIKGDPNCHRSNCGGKGYVGVRVNPGEQPTVLLCSCGKWVETDWARMMKRYEKMGQDTAKHFDYLHQALIGLRWEYIALKQTLEVAQSRTVMGRIRKLYRQFTGKKDPEFIVTREMFEHSALIARRKYIKGLGADEQAEVPVVGEVKS